MKNPFQYGNVVSGEDFCNRDDERRDLRDSILSGQNMLIYSERRMGKTSLMKEVMSELEDEGVRCAYIDLWPTDDRLSFARAIGQGIAAELSSRVEQAMSWLMETFQSFRVTSSMNQQGEISYSFDFQGDPDEIDLEDVLEVPEKLSEKLNEPVLIVFDEIQEIAEYDSDYVEKKLRSVIQHQDEVTYVFLGSRRHLIHEMFMEESSPFYHSAKKLLLKPIGTEEWKPFIRERFQTGERDVAESLIEEICEITEGHPKYTQHFCEALWSETEPGDTIAKSDLERARQKVMEEESYAYTVILENLTNNQKRLLVGLAKAEKGASIYSDEFMDNYRLKGNSHVQRGIEALKDKDLVDKDDVGYFILDRFLKLWLVNEYSMN